MGFLVSKVFFFVCFLMVSCEGEFLGFRETKENGPRLPRLRKSLPIPCQWEKETFGHDARKLILNRDVPRRPAFQLGLGRGAGHHRLQHCLF